MELHAEGEWGERGGIGWMSGLISVRRAPVHCLPLAAGCAGVVRCAGRTCWVCTRRWKMLTHVALV